MECKVFDLCFTSFVVAWAHLRRYHVFRFRLATKLSLENCRVLGLMEYTLLVTTTDYKYNYHTNNHLHCLASHVS